MDTQRLVEAARKDGLVDDDQLERARVRQRELQAAGDDRDLWSILHEQQAIGSDDIRRVEEKLATGAFRDQEVAGYRILHRIGSGGMGDVFLGRSAAGQEAAVKILPARLCKDREHLARFVREAKALAALRHPHITAFIDAGDHDGRPYLTMELVRGRTIKERLREEGALTQIEALWLLVQIGGAMAYASAKGLVHRDIKPANIILGRPAANSLAPFTSKICDFGLVKFVEDHAAELDDDGTLTLSGIALGTPHYMSPEQATGEADIDLRSDIYSLGATLYHGLMGRTLYSGRTSAVIMYKQVTAAIDVSPLHGRGTHPDLVELLRDMLRKERAERPATWEEVIERAEAVLADAGGGGPKTDPEIAARLRPAGGGSGTALLRRRRRRSVVHLVVACLVLVALAAAAALAFLPGSVPAARFLEADPATLATVLDQLAKRDVASATTIDLRPGIYRTALVLGPSHADLVLRAPEGGGAVLRPSASDQPLVTVEAGAGGVRLVGLILEAPVQVAVEIAADASCFFKGVRVHGPTSITVGGEFHATNSRIEGDIAVRPGGTLQLAQCVLSGYLPLLAAEEAGVHLHSVALHAAPGARSGTVATMTGGTLSADAVRIGARGCEAGLALVEPRWVELTDVAIDGVATGMRLRDATLGVAAGISIAASHTGLAWEGERRVSWRWENWAIESPRPVTGLADAPPSGPGADRQRLAALPSP